MPSQIQSLIFEKRLYTPRMAVFWAEQHGFSPWKRFWIVEPGESFWRISLLDQKRFRRTRVKQVERGIKAQIGIL